MIDRTHLKGFLITLAGVLAFTPDTLLVRLTRIDDLHMAVGRGLIGGGVVLLGCALWYRGAFWRQMLSLGAWGLLVALLGAAGSLTFYAALERTSVANVLVMFATAPLVGAILARVALGERVAPATWLAIAGAGAGLVVVAAPGLESGRWTGDAFAFANTAIIAAMFTVIRRHREVNMIPAAGLGLLIAAAFAAPFAQYTSMVADQWLWLLVGGAVVLPAGLTLLTLGPRYLPVPEVAMLTLLETVLGPLWVWAVIGESPPSATLLGGAVVLVTLFVHSAWRLRGARAPVPEPARG